ncbi:MAG: FAD/NAD(P)-binding oxidoreductase [Candidatus Sulfotelmatobacter sp.]
MTGVHHRFEVLVIGGGPAGLAAATCAAESGLQVGIVDDSAQLGGQIWRSAVGCSRPAEADHWIERLIAAGGTPLCGIRIYHQPQPRLLLGEGTNTLHEFSYGKLILATGARERFLPFPGWTLPNVMGAGGLQAMVKSGLPIRGKRVVVAGSGPLLLAVAAHLRKQGAEIPLICEQASWRSLARFGFALLGHPGKIAQALQLKRELAGVPFSASSWLLEAGGKNRVETVTISQRGRTKIVPCDYIACGFHLVPNVELPLLLGCEIENGYVAVDDFQTTTLASVFCAGEPTGIGGMELAIVEGQIAGLAAADRVEEARILFAEREKLRGFARSLERAFQLQAELKSLPAPETIICRCEDVPYSRLVPHTSWRAAKLHTRCGMGPCQGRVCGPATEFLFEWNPDSVRPPIFPTYLENLAAIASQSAAELDEVSGGH